MLIAMKPYEKEVEKLLSNGLIKEETYSKWVANSIFVKKNNRDWRFCIDFTNHNKACSKDSFLFPRIDQMVNATAGHELLN